jgi:transcriptional regulator with XRE-family HTH domain
MARRPRPVDPSEGPLQAFAYDLRQLREKAGNPTYRVLAGKAGYSPATLSEAARGQRRPSLDVTMAYVGACGGDPDEWRLRWHDLATAEAETAAETATDAGTEPADPAEVAPPAEPPPSRPRRRWTRPLVLASAALLVAAATGTVVRARPWASGEPNPSGCPRAKARGKTFTGQTYAYTRVRKAAALSAPVMDNVPAGCNLVFTGYCLGDIVTDRTARTPDARWFMLAGGGVMASAVVHGNPPPGARPSPCPGSVTPPAAIHLNVRRAKGELRLQATGQGLRIVGFTSLDTSATGDSRWHQINGLTRSPSSVFETRWQPSRVTDLSSPGRRVIVAAVACLGGDGPTSVVDAQEIQPDGPLHATPKSLSSTALEAATRSACQYP